MPQALIVGRYPLYRLSVAKLLRQCDPGFQARESAALEGLPTAHVAQAQTLILCGHGQATGELEDRLMDPGCRFAAFRVLFCEQLGMAHHQMIAEGVVDLILPMAVSWQDAERYLRRLLVDLEPEVGIEALQDPRLVASFIPDIADLTYREQRVLRHLREGLSNQGIAQQMAITINTVKVHLARICRKTGVNNRTQAVCLSGSMMAAS